MTAKKQKQPKQITRQYLENAGLYYLQHYATSAENFRRVMRRKIKRSCDFHKSPAEEFWPVIEELVARYVAAGLLNDASFAEARVATLRRQGRSKGAILAMLQAKGLPRNEIEAALDAHDGEGAELEAARRLVKRKKLGRAADPHVRRKELAALARAGFSYETAKAALDYPGEDD